MAKVKIFGAIVLAVFSVGAGGLPQGTGAQSFHAWAGFGVGSSETLESTAENPKGVLASTTQEKLIEKADDHLVLEISPTVVVNGETQTVPSTKLTVQAAPDSTVTVTQIGTEDVTAAGKTFSCKICTVDNSQAGQNIKLKIWTCADVPGGIVKLELDGPSIKIRSSLKRFEVK